MSNYVLSCCSTADLTKEHLESRDLHYLYFHYFLDDKEYLDDLGQTMSFPDFYQALADGAEPRTAQVNTSQYVEHFTRILAQGHDVFHVCLSSGLSGSINAAHTAVELLAPQFPERKIYIIDSLAASSGYGLLMDKLADLRDAGYDIDQLRDWLEENKLKLHHWFFSTDLAFYVKGGRISKAAGWFGGMLNICPLLNMDHLGHLVPREKIRGKKKVIRAMVEQMEACAEGGLAYDGKCYMSQSACYEDARAVADLVEARFPNLKGKVEINYVGTTIGSHTGPGTVALFFWGTQRVD